MKQTFADFELILVDDGSPDNSAEICKKYVAIDSRVKLVQKPNGGLVSARIAGAKVTAGEYVLCLDSDDWISEDCLDKFNEAIEQWKNPDFLASGYYVTDGIRFNRVRHGVPSGYYDKIRIEQEIYPLLFERKDGKQFPTGFSAIKREKYVGVQCRVDPGIMVGEDHAYVKPCVFASDSVYIIEDFLYYYRQILTSMTKEKKPHDWEGVDLLLEHYRDSIDLKRGDFQSQIYRYAIHGLFNTAISQFYRKENYFTIVRSIRARLNNPFYQEAIREYRCDKKYIKGRLAHIALKYQMFFLMFLYSKRDLTNNYFRK